MATAKKVAKKATKKVAKKAAPALKKTASRKVAKKGAVESMLDSATKHVKKLVHAAKRTLIEPTPGDKRYVRRDSEGKFKDVVDVGKSLSADKRTTAKKVVKPGQGDKGDVKKS